MAQNTADEADDKWDLSQISRSSELILDGHSGTYLVVKQKRDSAGNVLALEALGPEDEMYELRKVATTETFLHVKPADRAAGVYNTEDIAKAFDYDVIGQNEEELRRYVREIYYGED